MVPPEFTRAVLFARRPLSKMDKVDRTRAIYQHSCLRYIKRQYLVNATVRERFGIEIANKAMASRLIREALEAGVIRLVKETAADKLRAYVPFWA
jgi:ATP-dependent DNA helicase RecG